MNTIHEIQSSYAEDLARSALAKARCTLESTLHNLDKFAEQLDQVESLKDKANVMNWALNALACNILPNLRLDMIATAQAELIKASVAAKTLA